MKIEMSAMEYLKAKERMENWCKKEGKDRVAWVFFEKFHPETSIDIVYNWNKDHPVKTMMQDFFERFPNAPRNGDGTPQCCPYDCGYVDEADCPDYEDCFGCWSRPIE